jgi:hypothetical protein
VSASAGGSASASAKYLAFVQVASIGLWLRVHQAAEATLAAASVSSRPWEIADIVALVEAGEAKPAKRGPYKKRIAG